MKKFVINLQERKDRLEFFSQNWKHLSDLEVFRAIGKDELHLFDFDFMKTWTDPLLSRGLTQGEIGCFLSHYTLWKKCVELNEPILIFEDDVVPNHLLNYDYTKMIPSLMYGLDLLYLSYNEMNKEKAEHYPGSNLIIKPGYPYWACAYALSPNGARKLLDVNIDIINNIIPVDEYLPLMAGCVIPNHFKSEALKIMSDRLERFSKLTYGAFKDQLATPASRSELGSDIENSPAVLAPKPTKFNTVTVATDRSKAWALEDSAKKHGFDLTVLGAGTEWTGGDIKNGPGGFMKVRLLRDFLMQPQHEDKDIVLFLDGYDTFINEDITTVRQRFLDFNCDVLFAAEKTCWPDGFLAKYYGNAHTDYHYLNSGCFIGRVSALRKIVAIADTYSDIDHVDDQYFYHLVYLATKSGVVPPEHENKPWLLLTKALLSDAGVTIALDHENYVFQCVAKAMDDIKFTPTGQFMNDKTRCTFCILHGNGGEAEKAFFDKMVEQRGFVHPSRKNNYFIDTTTHRSLGDVKSEILTFDFLTPEACDAIIAKAEEHGSWAPLPGDSYPAQEIRMHTLWPEMFELICEQLKKSVFPQAEKHWWPLHVYGIRDMFVMKYTPDTQNKLACHNDASLISGSIKLNEDYEGGELYFYRQNLSNAPVPRGKLIVWPSGVTHGHECTEITKGTKYSLTIWTSRFPNDKNY